MTFEDRSMKFSGIKGKFSQLPFSCSQSSYYWEIQFYLLPSLSGPGQLWLTRGFGWNCFINMLNFTCWFTDFPFVRFLLLLNERNYHVIKLMPSAFQFYIWPSCTCICHLTLDSKQKIASIHLPSTTRHSLKKYASRWGCSVRESAGVTLSSADQADALIDHEDKGQ